jgi:subtilase family serine protease
VPDVAADAYGHTGMVLVVSAGRGQINILPGGGTSGSTPFWAGIIALANQYAGHDLGFVNSALYAIARGPSYHAAFHDITKGNNAVEFPPQTFRGYAAAPGWDPVTGLGSPDARVLIPLLARSQASH